MTVKKEEYKVMPGNNLEQFYNQQYINLESFRKNGQGVKTPIWFAEDEGIFYAYSLADSFKIKRIRNNPRVRVAPCNVSGKLKGEWVEATARILDPSYDKHTHQLLNRKYGLIKRIFDVLNRLRRGGRVSLAIQID